MRKPQAISPSAFMLWEKDQKEYALRHLVDNRPPRTLQELPASVGSSFDAWVKSNLHADLFGAGCDPKYEFAALFESQVEAHNRDAAHGMGLRCFDNYVHTGAYDELRDLMADAQEDPQFEFDAARVVNGVPISGKPDCRFVHKTGVHFILDWKVKGYCSKWGASPSKNYRLCRDGLEWPKPSQSNGKAHKGYKPVDFHGIEINESYMESGNAEWAIQLGMYGWMMGEEVGDENVVVAIDEIVSKSRQGNDPPQPPLLRVANHRCRIGKDFQEDVMKRIRILWDAIQSGWILQDMTREESDNWFAQVEMKAVGLQTEDDDPHASFYNEVSRPGYRK